MSAPTPVLDFFKRGEVPRDVRLLAAQGGVAVRAHEQLAILILLLGEDDEEIRATAEQTIGRIPLEPLRFFLSGSDVSISIRDFFAARGILPIDAPEPIGDDPLIDSSGEALDAEAAGGTEDERRETVVQQLAKMGFTERLKAAVKGSREMRAMLIRDPNKMIASAVLSSPKLSEPEIESFARMASLSEEVLRIIANNRAWTKNYNVVLGLTRNPKTPLALSLNFLQRLSGRDLNQVSVDRNVPEPLRIAARKKVAANRAGSG